MDKKVRKRMLCGVLAAALLLSGCGRVRSAGGGEIHRKRIP